MKFLASIVFVLCASVSAHGENVFKTLTTDAEHHAWEAVGRLDFDGTSFCTGSLISPTIVLTAAHCLYDIETKQLHNPEDIQFRGGWGAEHGPTQRSVRQFFIHPNFSNLIGSQQARLLNDVALVALKQPVSEDIPMSLLTNERLRKDDFVGAISYAHDRAQSLSLQEVCHVLARQGGILVTSCDVNFGSSGAPIFSIIDGSPKIASVVSAKAIFRGEKVSIGTTLEGSIEPLLQMAELELPSFEVTGLRGVLTEISRSKYLLGRTGE